MLDVGELADEGAQAGDVVGGDEQVNVRQGGLHSAGGGFVAGIAHQRVEPEDAAGVLLEEVHALIERLDVARVPAVADYQHHRAVIHERESVVLHEGLQRLADLGASGPVRNRGREPIQRFFQLFGLQRFGDTVQRGAEDEGFDAAIDALEGVDELDEEAAVEVHGLADIAEQHELEPLPLALTVREVEDFPAPAQGRLYMEMAPWLALWPGLCLTMVVFSLNMFGDAVRDLLDPRLRGGEGSYGTAVVKRKRGLLSRLLNPFA